MSLDQPHEFVKHQTVTRDAFLGGRITLSQPRRGFRAGLDSVLLGAAVPKGSASLLDLGAGVGTAGLTALALGLARDVTLAERDEMTLGLARRNIADNGFGQAARAVAVDVEGSASARLDAGLRENAYDVVIANPPFFNSGGGTLSPDSGRAAARHMREAAIDSWLRCAAGAAAAGGQAIFIYPTDGLTDLLAAFGSRFGGITTLPLCPRPDAPTSRILVRGTKGSRAPLTLLASRSLHEADGRAFAPQFDAIFRGKAALDW